MGVRLGVRSAVLALRQPYQFRRYISLLKTYDEVVGNGLRPLRPVIPEQEMTVTVLAYHPVWRH